MDKTNESLKSYMVEFDIYNAEEEEDFQEILSDQQDLLDEYFNSGKLLSYTVSSDHLKAWAVMIASSESELMNYIDHLPLSDYMDFHYYELLFYNTIQLMPTASLN